MEKCFKSSRDELPDYKLYLFAGPPTKKFANFKQVGVESAGGTNELDTCRWTKKKTTNWSINLSRLVVH